ncbi:MAG: AraC family transcriptional regulator [Aphanocapsa sp. GSE-SYN-MK-11-07L]|jgi:AraC-like DNA-binding protein|nr:AraC family transcriptional regulator [Aphanocapsa sp. GSE-SYN-MK-11-07L]
MTITLTVQEDAELWDEAARQMSRIDPEVGSELNPMPSLMGSGYDFDVNLYPDFELKIGSYTFREDLQIQQPEWNHPVQLGVTLSGISLDSQCGGLDNSRTIISGSGVQRQNSYICSSAQPHLHINLEMSPARFTTLFSDVNGELPAELKFLVKGNDRQTLMYPKTTAAIQRVAHEIIGCPYSGAAKRFFLQAKSHELMALMLAPIIADQGKPNSPTGMKPLTIAQIYAARDRLELQLENPPSTLELAQQVGLSDRTLQKGFRALFGTTPFDYLTEQRMSWAAEQLRETNRTVAEIANLVGYANPAKFAAAFKRKFGITPSECAQGKK